MFDDNVMFQDFRQKLSDAGYDLMVMWSCKCMTTAKYDDVALFQVRSNGRDPQASRPAIGTVVIRDYGKDGYGCWAETGPKVDDDIKAIVGSLGS